MDQQSFDVLKSLNLNGLNLIHYKDFENDNLLRVKNERSMAEYCWTCTPSLIEYTIDHFKLDHCTYVDADLMFFHSLTQISAELKDFSISLTDHFYSPEYDQSSTSGRYCVQYMYFRNNKEGRTALTWWKEKCIEWCYAKFENGKFGDQKYLDDWTSRFSGVRVLEQRGAGVAPWNVQQYILKDQGELKLKTGDQDYNLIFYHYHGLKFHNEDHLELGLYKLSRKVKKLIYGPYVRALLEAEIELRSVRKDLNVHGVLDLPVNIQLYKQLLKRTLKGRNNFHRLSFFL
jgi:hypothetical protein